jgi:hypothetical protein
MLQYQRARQLCSVFFIGLMFATFAIGGCNRNSGPERVVVSGTITYKGNPIPDGQIRFVPDEKSHVPINAANIVDGQYKADLHGGVPVGTFKVEVKAFVKAPSPPEPMWTPKNYLPKRYGADSQLQITVDPGSRKIVKNFDLTD